MTNITEAISITKENLDLWHKENKTWWEFEFSQDDLLVYNCVKLAYHDYATWHMIERYQSNDANEVKFIYEGGLEHNKYRNECIQNIDEYFYKFQSNAEVFNSEGVGTIVDRFINDYLKYIHLVEDSDERATQLEFQINFSITSAEKLVQEMIDGTRSIIIFKKFKTSGYNNKAKLF
jgi:hypothetical protein